MKTKSVFMIVLRLVSAIILLQTLYFKFGGAEESIYIFTKIGMEPVGRIGSGIVELIAAVLLLWPRSIAIGALLALSTMSGAIFFHLTILGIEVKGDGGYLFFLAILVWISSFLLIINYKNQLFIVYKKRAG